MSSPQQLRTTTTDLLKIKHPVLLAGMNVAAGPKLAAAVTNAGGLGVIGGVRVDTLPRVEELNADFCEGWIHSRHASRTGRRAQELFER
jgi:NAD(P)H-dependent flavin oxidoreductase YrpB (nitropropane dioxygenase family)